VSGTSFGPNDLSLLKGFSKNLSFEDFQIFQEIGAYCGLDLMISEMNKHILTKLFLVTNMHLYINPKRGF
jgi:hypothetical protein